MSLAFFQEILNNNTYHYSQSMKPEIYLLQHISLMNLTSESTTYQVNTVEYLNFSNLKKKQNHFDYLLYGFLTSNLNSKQNEKVIQLNLH